MNYNREVEEKLKKGGKYVLGDSSSRFFYEGPVYKTDITDEAIEYLRKHRVIGAWC